jgi:hypothetical protein
MGHYLCPRCGGTDSYLGNVLVSRKGVSLTQEIGNTGVYATSSTGGTETVQAVKCRNCSEVLSAANYVKSEAELQKEAAENKRRNLFSNVVGILIIVLIVGWIVENFISYLMSR